MDHAGSTMTSVSRATWLTLLTWLLLPLASGAALAVYITTGMSLRDASIAFTVVGAGLWASNLSRTDAEGRRRLARELRRGLLAGAVATLAYDGVRYVLASVLEWSLSSFATFPLFGAALTGEPTSSGAAIVAGIAFHVANGLGFAVAYSLFVSQPTIRSAIVWAIGLEVAMLLLYPGWLNVPIQGELGAMSLAGHLAYGTTLGYVGRRLTARKG